METDVRTDTLLSQKVQVEIEILTFFLGGEGDMYEKDEEITLKM